MPQVQQAESVAKLLEAPSCRVSAKFGFGKSSHAGQTVPTKTAGGFLEPILPGISFGRLCNKIFERFRHMPTMKFPEWWKAPEELLDVDGHCGPIAAWSVLHYFGKRVTAAQIMTACRHTKRHGVFAVHLAAGLKELGLQVSFHSEPDNDVGGFEMRGYRRLKRLGVPVENALDLSELLKLRKRRRIPIVLYDKPSQVGHFSIVLGTTRGTLRLAEGTSMPKEEFIAAWSAPRILRQCVFAWL